MNKLERFDEQIYTMRYKELVTKLSHEMQILVSHLGLDLDGFDLGEINSSSVGNYMQSLSRQELSEILRAEQEAMVRYD